MCHCQDDPRDPDDVLNAARAVVTEQMALLP